MDKREQLQENYEDALLALILEQNMEAEGQRLSEENQRLLQDPGNPTAPAGRACRVGRPSVRVVGFPLFSSNKKRRRPGSAAFF